MGYNDKYIERCNNTVDDEYQRVLLHQASTINFNALMWLNFISAAIMVWVFPSREVGNITLVMVMLPAFSTVAGYSWLRKRIPLPRANKISPVEWVGIAAVLVVWGLGVLFAESTAWTELLGTVMGMLVGVLVGLVAYVVILKNVYPRIRKRDQKRLDEELDD